MDGSREYNAKQNKTEKDKYHDFTHTWNLRNKKNEHGERGTNQKTDFFFSTNRLLTIVNKYRVTRGEDGGGWAN